MHGDWRRRGREKLRPAFFRMRDTHMKLLIIGGTKFLGRHLAAAALTRGHEVTLFNRGLYSDEHFPEIEQVRGDRHRDLARLAGRHFDAVVDTCGYLPQSVRTAAEALAGSVETYVFISSISAYADFSEPNLKEDAPVAVLAERERERFANFDFAREELGAAALGESYGALKALCERAAERVMPGRVLNVRAGLIVGSFDPTDRFTYWALRTAAGGRVFAPGDPERFVQFIDARDLAGWIVSAAERRVRGTFNASGLPFRTTMGELLGEIKRESRSDAEFHFAPDEFLAHEQVAPWSELPLYLPSSDETTRGFLSVSVDRALREGLVFRPLAETIRETLAWGARHRRLDELRAGLSRTREAELLARLERVPELTLSSAE